MRMAFAMISSNRVARILLLAITRRCDRRRWNLRLLFLWGRDWLPRGYTMTVEAHAVDVVEGTTTYRMYVDMLNATDYLSSVYGNEDNTLLISSTSPFYNDVFGSTLGLE